MPQLQAVLWTKGVLLTPQHLQAQDRFFEDVLQFQLAALSFCPWGLHRLTIDREALAGGVVSVSSVAGLLPDGLPFDVPAADPAPPPRPLEGCWLPDQQALTVYLAIPERAWDGVNVAAAPQDRAARYLARVVLRRDENTGLAEKPLTVQQKNFRLLVENESLEGSTTIPIARVQRTSTGSYELDARFVPPLIDLGASDYMLSLARRLVERLAAKSTQLSERRRQKGLGLAEFGISDVASFWLLYTVNSYLPQVRHLFETRRGHPAELFSLMLTLAGALTTFSASAHPRDLPTYEHTDLSKCFTTLDEQLANLLDTVVPSNYVSLPLKSVRPTVYAVALDREEYLRATGWYLAVSADMPPQDVARNAPRLLKLSSSENIETLIRQAVPGLELSPVAEPPNAIPVKMGYQYFRIRTEGPEWQAITRARNLAAYVPADLANPQLSLLVVLPVAT
jgi:type VI secretion system protein ImpJ